MSRTFLPHVITDDSALGGLEIERSFRFNSASSTHLERTPSSAGNRKVWTWSAWVKRGNLGLNTATLFHAYDGSSSNRAVINFQSDDTLNIDQGGGSGVAKGQAESTMVFRDVGAWYHIVIRANYSDSAASDRIKLYVNGTQQTLTFDVAFTDEDGQINGTFAHQIGEHGGGNYFDGYMAEVNFVDGYAYDASYFGYTEGQTGIWLPKRYEGTYGTNGFRLDFSDNSSITNMMKDKSGNGNNFSPDNCNTEDSMLDTPTNNFATMTPLNGYSGLSEGNLRFNTYNDSSGPRSTQATIALPKSGKWYWEARYQESGTGTITTKYFGVSQLQSTNAYLTAPYVYYDRTTIANGNSSENISHGQDWYNGVGVPAILGCAVNVDNNTVSFYHNNTLQGTITLPTLTSLQEYFFTWANTSGGSSSSLNDTFNFGADSTFQGQVSRGNNTDANGIGDFKYAPPSGHLALCSANLPPNVPSIIRPQRHFETLIYDGDGSSSRDVTGLEFRPDMIWIKNRSQASTHSLQDSIIGFGDDKTLRPDTSNALDTNGNLYGYINHTLPNGFNVNGGSEHASSRVNSSSSGAKHVAWCWKGGGTAVSNTDGSITTQVSANPTAGFSIVKWTGNQTSGATIGHGLGATPQAGFFKRYDGTGNWIFPFFDNQVAGKLNNNDGFINSYYNTFFPSQPNSTTVTIGSNDDINRNTSTYAAYIFTSVEGYCKIGTYTGVGGSGNGNFVHTGFRPAFLIVTNAAAEFTLLVDSKRGAYNPIDERLFPGSNMAESDEIVVDFLSNGFKARNEGGANIISGDGSTYLYIAYAEQPGTTPFDTFPNAR